MSEARLLASVSRFPHPKALARHLRDGSAFPALRSLEARGYVWRERGEYRLTQRGRNELAMTRAIARLAAVTATR